MKSSRSQGWFESARLLTMTAGALVGCATSEESVAEYRGEYVVVHTEFGAVCKGTLAKLDHEVARVDAALGLAGSTHVSEVWILGDDVSDRCPSWASAACASGGRVYIHFSLVQELLAHELVHVRVSPTGANVAKHLFTEGIAEALSRPRCYDESRVFSSPESYIEPSNGADLPEHTYYLGGELVHWLLQNHGPEVVLEFMQAVDRQTPPVEFRAAYTWFFGGSFDDDLFAHLRPLTADYEPWERGCDVPEAIPPHEGGKGYVFQAAIDCESPRVQNDFWQLSFGLDDRAVVEWSIDVTEADSGYFVLQGDLSEKSLTLRGCNCRTTPASTVGSSPPPISVVSLASGGEILLAPGRYLVTWRGPLGDVVDARLSPPCSYEGDCSPGQQCTIWNRCEPEHDSLGLPGEVCELVEGQRSCVSGSRCVNGVCVSECSPSRPCPEGEVCGLTRLCGLACDLLAQDCGAGSSCILSGASDGTGHCAPAGVDQLLDPCDRLEDVCASGLVCGSCGGGQREGCCVPLCESSVDCPAEAPTCAFALGSSVGVCV